MKQFSFISDLIYEFSQGFVQLDDFVKFINIVYMPLMLFVVARKMIVAQSKNFIDEGALGFLNFYRKGSYCVGIDKTKRIIFAEKIKNVISDIYWTDTHPIKQVYLNCFCNTGQKMWDVLPIINAVKGDDWFTLSPRGTVELLPNTRTNFTPDPKGNIRYQIAGNNEWVEKILEEIKSSYKKN